nr:uncharacterized protein LOC101886291 isoform X7 [Danio rerio]|eukprot:XP_021331350.1 uncharacterized protein LOC101886291 isoform X7 [Danio rerio]
MFMSLSTVSFYSCRARTYTLRTFMLSLCGKKLLTTLLLDYRCMKIAYQVDHWTWTEKTGYDFPALPHQTRGNDCGVFVLMYTLSMVCGIGFQFQEMDIPIIRQWWCLLLMERF